MAQVLWTEQAEIDLENIAFRVGIESQRPSTALKIIEEFTTKCDRYAEQPEIGTILEEIDETIRWFLVKRWVVLYRQIDGGIEIRRIVDGSRDFPSLFGYV